MGVVKITPAHDPNDFEVGNRHNLERIVVINPNGTMNEKAGKYNGLERFECRKQLVKDLEEQGYLINIEKIVHSVGHSERSNVMIEPYLSKQWFVKMRPLADKVLENQQNKETKVNFVPSRYEKTMNHWMEITYDWCISRQLWWGHRIPAWYKNDEVYVGINPPEGEGWVQDEDVLDTWFSSALWPFSTLGFPEQTNLIERYYPNDVLVTGYDIIPFWVNRMTFQGLHFTNSRPFKDCLIHGLIRDSLGRKMSKSLGNGVDPMDVIEEYGCDALRYFLSTSSAAGQDLRFDEEKVKSTWNFINKLWNASRYVLMNIENLNNFEINYETLSLEDKWILTELNQTIDKVTKNMEKYRFNDVGNALYEFTWVKFCDWFIELSKGKTDENTKIVLFKVLTCILKMLHPFMPFVTEEIYGMLPKHDESIMISEYPQYDKNEIYTNEHKLINEVIENITNIRNYKVENNITKDTKVVVNTNENLKSIFVRLLKLNEIEEVLNFIEFKSNIISLKFEVNETNLEEQQSKILEQIEKLKLSILKREQLLSNDNYVNKAPQHIVDLDREKLNKEKQELEILTAKLK